MNFLKILNFYNRLTHMVYQIQKITVQHMIKEFYHVKYTILKYYKKYSVKKYTLAI